MALVPGVGEVLEVQARGQAEAGELAGRRERGQHDADDRIERDQREEEQDRVVERLFPATDHCGRSEMRVIRKLKRKITHASEKPIAAAEPTCPTWNARL